MKGDIAIETIVFGVITVISLIILVILFKDKLFAFFTIFTNSAVGGIKSILCSIFPVNIFGC